jgi:hypothetical protein
MGYKFRVLLGGLCAFVPAPVAPGQTKSASMRALMVSTDPAAGHKRIRELTHTPELHGTVMRYERRDEAGVPPGAPAGASGGPPPPPRFAAIRFDEEEITVSVANRVANTLQIAGNLTAVKSGPSVPGNYDLDWIPNLADVLPAAGNGKVELDCLAKNPKKGFLNARVVIDHGTLKVGEFAQFQGAEVQAEFVPLPSGAAIQRQALPHRIAWELDVPDLPGNVPAGASPFEPVTFNVRSFAAGSKPLPAVTFQPPANTTEVTVHLVNLCCGDYFNPKPHARLEDDDDFESFYMLLDNFSTLINDKPLPIPVGTHLPLLPLAQRKQRGGPTGIHCSVCRVAPQ